MQIPTPTARNRRIVSAAAAGSCTGAVPLSSRSRPPPWPGREAITDEAPPHRILHRQARDVDRNRCPRACGTARQRRFEHGPIQHRGQSRRLARGGVVECRHDASEGRGETGGKVQAQDQQRLMVGGRGRGCLP